MVARMPSIAQVSAAVARRYPPALAEPWDAVGLVCGRPEAAADRILVTIDVTQPVVDRALDWGARLIIAHHPLLLAPVTSVTATGVKGRILHDLIEGRCGLLTAHTNADRARPGVSDALAAALGIQGTGPLEPAARRATDKLVTFVPPADADRVIEALTAAGAGRIGDYEHCAYTVEGTGMFRPLPGATPHVGQVGELELVAERRVEMILPRGSRSAVVNALLASHPYEQPAFDVTELADLPGSAGLGRVGLLAEPRTLAGFAEQVAAALPGTWHGVRVAGDPDRPVRRVAVCGGSGDSLLGAADAAGADVLVTSDLKHHRVSEHLDAGGCAVIDVAHWASEFPWCAQLAGYLRAEFASRPGGAGTSVDVQVCELVTDPWTAHVRSSP